ncbi:Hypothetical predicted protein, partial [Prunus dulcis]
MKALKEQRCEREPSPPVGVGVDDDDFAGLACPPLDDLEAVFILESETTTFDPSNLFDDVKLDDHNMAIQEKPNKPPSHGTGKSLETLRLMLSAPPPSSCQQNPTEPIKSDAHHQRQDWDDEGKLEQEQAVDQFDESQQNPKEPTKSTDHDLHHRQDWDDEEKLETSVRESFTNAIESSKSYRHQELAYAFTKAKATTRSGFEQEQVVDQFQE